MCRIAEKTVDRLVCRTLSGLILMARLKHFHEELWVCC